VAAPAEAQQKVERDAQVEALRAAA
jgi:hypothetical protein